MAGTERVTPALIAQWASATVAEWLPGYTDHNEALGGQHRIRLLRDEPAGLVFEVATIAGDDARQFLVSLTVKPLSE